MILANPNLLDLADKPIVLILAGVYVGMSLVGFVLMGLDKKRAIRRQWRIPEAHLLGVALLGGAGGVALGMLVFRHKIRDIRFYVPVPLFLLVQAGLLVWILLST